MGNLRRQRQPHPLSLASSSAAVVPPSLEAAAATTACAARPSLSRTSRHGIRCVILAQVRHTRAAVQSMAYRVSSPGSRVLASGGEDLEEDFEGHRMCSGHAGDGERELGGERERVVIRGDGSCEGASEVSNRLVRPASSRVGELSVPEGLQLVQSGDSSSASVWEEKVGGGREGRATTMSSRNGWHLCWLSPHPSGCTRSSASPADAHEERLCLPIR